MSPLPSENLIFEVPGGQNLADFLCFLGSQIAVATERPPDEVQDLLSGAPGRLQRWSRVGKVAQEGPKRGPKRSPK